MSDGDKCEAKYLRKKGTGGGNQVAAKEEEEDIDPYAVLGLEQESVTEKDIKKKYGPAIMDLEIMVVPRPAKRPDETEAEPEKVGGEAEAAAAAAAGEAAPAEAAAGEAAQPAAETEAPAEAPAAEAEPTPA